MEAPEPSIVRRKRRVTSDSDCGEEDLERVAKLLKRQPSFIDKRGYKCELLGAAIHPTSNELAYVESRAKKRWWTPMIDISIKIHLRDRTERDSATDIKSYNPFFGCDIGFFEWIDDTALLIYTEKHHTYICAFGKTWPPRFVEIEDRWVINNNMLGYNGYKQTSVQRLSIPDLSPHDPIAIDTAEEIDLLPADPYAA